MNATTASEPTPQAAPISEPSAFATEIVLEAIRSVSWPEFAELKNQYGEMDEKTRSSVLGGTGKYMDAIMQAVRESVPAAMQAAIDQAAERELSMECTTCKGRGSITGRVLGIRPDYRQTIRPSTINVPEGSEATIGCPDCKGEGTRSKTE